MFYRANRGLQEYILNYNPTYFDPKYRQFLSNFVFRAQFVITNIMNDSPSYFKIYFDGIQDSFINVPKLPYTGPISQKYICDGNNGYDSIFFFEKEFSQLPREIKFSTNSDAEAFAIRDFSLQIKSNCPSNSVRSQNLKCLCKEGFYSDELVKNCDTNIFGYEFCTKCLPCPTTCSTCSRYSNCLSCVDENQPVNGICASKPAECKKTFQIMLFIILLFLDLLKQGSIPESDAENLWTDSFETGLQYSSTEDVCDVLEKKSKVFLKLTPFLPTAALKFTVLEFKLFFSSEFSESDDFKILINERPVYNLKYSKYVENRESCGNNKLNTIIPIKLIQAERCENITIYSKNSNGGPVAWNSSKIKYTIAYCTGGMVVDPKTKACVCPEGFYNYVANGSSDCLRCLWNCLDCKGPTECSTQMPFEFQSNRGFAFFFFNDPNIF